MMKKRIIITPLLAVFCFILIGLISCERESNRKEMGEGPLKCFIEGELLTDKYGDEVVFFKDGMTHEQQLEDRSLRVKAVDGKFYMTINSDHITKYFVALYDQVEAGRWKQGFILTEDNAHIKVQILDDKIIVKSDGEEGRKHEVLDSIEQTKFWNEYNDLAKQLNDSARNEHYTEAGLKIRRQMDSINAERVNFCINYYAEHPMVWALYDVLDAARFIQENSSSPGFLTDSELKQYESYMKLYDEHLSKTFPGHPIHEQIADLVRLRPGQVYIDYDIHTADGKAVPISSLIKGRVALINFWASWCGSCREHSKAIIPLYEKYKDKGFTIVAIAREKNLKAMEKAMKKDGYPWPSYLEPMNDENRVWSKNGLSGGSGGMVLVDRDGTILSTSTEAEVLEPLIKKALNIN